MKPEPVSRETVDRKDSTILCLEMPIKEISKEEQSHLYLAGGAKREHLHLTETDRGETGTLFIKVALKDQSW